MADRYDLVVANARLRGRGDLLHHIGIRSGRIAAIEPSPLRGDAALDAAGNLVIPSFVNAHLHLDKVYTLSLAGEEPLQHYTGGQMGQAMTAIELAARVKDRYEEGWIHRHAHRVLLDGLKHGVTHVQAFADTDTRGRLEGVKALLRLRDEWRGVVDVRVVAFPQDGVLRDPGGGLRAAGAGDGRGRGRRHPLDRTHRSRRAGAYRPHAGSGPCLRPGRGHAHRRRGRSRAAHHRNAGRGGDPGRGGPGG